MFRAQRTDVDHLVGRRVLQAQLLLGLLHGRRTAADLESDAASLDQRAHLPHGLGDDLRADAGRIAHGDRKSNGHGLNLP
jgi:hypothetical protein